MVITISKIDEIAEFNEKFVKNKEYEKYVTSKFPDKKIAILSCMDTRLTELLPAALNLKNGNATIIKNAGALISHPFGSVMRSLIVSIYELDVEEIIVVNHYDCGMQNIEPTKIINKMIERGVKKEDIDFINYLGVDMNNWIKGFEDPGLSVKETVKLIGENPLIPKDIIISGFLMDPITGKLDRVI